MSITPKEVEKLAFLSRLKLSEEQVARLTVEMGNIIEFAGKISALDTQNVDPTMHAVKLTNVFREDEVKPSFSQPDILANAPEADDNNFLVSKAVE